MPVDNSLKGLTGAVQEIAKYYPQLPNDVHDIRNAIVGPGGILLAVNSINERLDRVEKKAKLDKLRGRGNRATEINSRKLLNNTDGISKNLSKILKNMENSPRERIRSDSNDRILFEILKNVQKISNKRNRINNDRLSGRRLSRDNFERGGKKLKGLEGLSQSIELAEKLKGIKLKDFLFAKKKLKNIKHMMTRFKNMFEKFKNQKELDGTFSFADSSIELVKKLSKISRFTRPAERGVKSLEKIILGKKGKGGLLLIFKKIDEHKKEIKSSKKTMQDILKSCGSMLLTSIALTGIAVIGIPALLGALVMKGVIWLLVGTYTLLSKSRRTINKGSTVLLLLSASIITFGLGLGLMAKMVKNMKLKDVGIMMASIAGIGLSVAGIGLLALPITIGSGVLLLMGASLGLFSIAVNAWTKIDTKKAMGNIKETIGGLREAFGLELGKGDTKKGVLSRIGGGMLSLAMSLLDFGSTLFMTGTLLLTGVALGMLYHGIKNWENFNGKKAAGNIKIAVGALKEAFGIEEGKDLKGKLSNLVGGPLELGVALFQGGEALVQMGIITIATGLSDMIRLFLIPWENYDAQKAAGNIKVAVGALKDAFGLDEGKDLKGKLSTLIGGPFEIGVALAQGGKTLAQMGIIAIATGLSDTIRLFLIPWEKYDARKAAGNIKIAIDALKDAFGLEGEKTKSTKFSKSKGSILDFGVALFQGGKTLAQMGTIAIATGLSDMIRLFLIPWNKYNPKKAILNLNIAVSYLKKIFDLDNTKDKKGKNIKLGGSIIDMGITLFQSGGILLKMGTITLATGMLAIINKSLRPWDNYNASTSMGNIKTVMTTLNDIFGFNDAEYPSGGKALKLVGSVLDLGTTLFQSGGTLVKMGLITISVGMLDKIREYIKPWEKFNANPSLENIRSTIDRLLNIFGIDGIDKPESDGESNKTLLGKVGRTLKSIGNVIEAPFKIATSLVDTASTLAQGSSTMARLSNVMHATSALFTIKGSLEPWDSYNSSGSLTNIKQAITGIGDMFREIETVRNLDKGGIFSQSVSSYFEDSSKKISNGIKELANSWEQSEILKSIDVPFKETVNSINSLDMSKASKIIDVFKSFSNIKRKNFDNFTNAVNKFSKSCSDLIDSLDKFNNSNTDTSNTSSEYLTGEHTSIGGGVDINNTQALAKAIADAIKSLPINVNNNMSDVRLVVNGEAGRRVILTLEN